MVHGDVRFVGVFVDFAMPNAFMPRHFHPQSESAYTGEKVEKPHKLPPLKRYIIHWVFHSRCDTQFLIDGVTDIGNVIRFHGHIMRVVCGGV